MPFVGDTSGLSFNGLRHRRTRSRDNIGEGETPPLTAAQWARIQSEWVTTRFDLLRGYGQRLDWTTMAMKAALFVLMSYSCLLYTSPSPRDS